MSGLSGEALGKYEELNEVGQAANRVGDYVAGALSFNAMDQLALDANDRLKRLHALNPGAKSYWSMGDFTSAGYMLDIAERIAEDLGLADERAIAISNAGRMATAQVMQNVGWQYRESALWSQALPAFAAARKQLRGHPHLYYRYANAQHGAVAAALGYAPLLTAQLLWDGMRVAFKKSPPYDEQRTYQINRSGLAQMAAAALLIPLGQYTPFLASYARKQLMPRPLIHDEALREKAYQLARPDHIPDTDPVMRIESRFGIESVYEESDPRHAQTTSGQDVVLPLTKYWSVTEYDYKFISGPAAKISMSSLNASQREAVKLAEMLDARRTRQDPELHTFPYLRRLTIGENGLLYVTHGEEGGGVDVMEPQAAVKHARPLADIDFANMVSGHPAQVKYHQADMIHFVPDGASTANAYAFIDDHRVVAGNSGEHNHQISRVRLFEVDTDTSAPYSPSRF